MLSISLRNLLKQFYFQKKLSGAIQLWKACAPIRERCSGPKLDGRNLLMQFDSEKFALGEGRNPAQLFQVNLSCYSTFDNVAFKLGQNVAQSPMKLRGGPVQLEKSNVEARERCCPIVPEICSGGGGKCCPFLSETFFILILEKWCWECRPSASETFWGLRSTLGTWCYQQGENVAAFSQKKCWGSCQLWNADVKQGKMLPGFFRDVLGGSGFQSIWCPKQGETLPFFSKCEKSCPIQVLINSRRLMLKTGEILPLSQKSSWGFRSTPTFPQTVFEANRFLDFYLFSLLR